MNNNDNNEIVLAMKKIVLMVAAAVMAVTSVNAQKGYDDTKHEVAISLGAGSNSQFMDAFEKIGSGFVSLGSVTYENEKEGGPLSAEYFYHVKNWLGVGGICALTWKTNDLKVMGNKIGESSSNYYTLMPAVKFNYLRKSYFGMYTKLAAGATMHRQSFESTDSEHKDESDSEIVFNWHVSLLGMEVGSPYIRGFLELGVGEQGIGQIGVRYKF